MNIMLPSIFSVLKQTHSNLQLVIVDDCSTDGTFQVLRKIQSLDSRIKIARTPRNLGTYWAKTSVWNVAMADLSLSWTAMI